MVMLLTKKPVQVTGVRWTGSNQEEVTAFCGDKVSFKDDRCIIHTLEGDHTCVPDAVIVKGVKGEFYPVDPEIFPETFVIDKMDEHYTDGTLRDGSTGADASESAQEARRGDPSLEAVWNASQRKKAPDSDWALPERKKLRIDDEKHVRLAWALVSHVSGITPAEVKEARGRILAKAKKLGMDTSEWEKKK